MFKRVCATFPGGTGFLIVFVVILFAVFSPWVAPKDPDALDVMNRFAAPIVPLCGVVETDCYYHEIHFPSVCLLQPGASATLSKGTPLVQVIPFQREAWGHEIAAWDEAARKNAIESLAANAPILHPKA